MAEEQKKTLQGPYRYLIKEDSGGVTIESDDPEFPGDTLCFFFDFPENWDGTPFEVVGHLGPVSMRVSGWEPQGSRP